MALPALTENNLPPATSSGQVFPSTALEDFKGLRDEIAMLRERLDFVLGLSPDGTRPFFVDGHPVHFVNAQQLSNHVPRSVDTLIEWAERGVIPGIYIPGKENKTKGSWMFDLVAVKRALDRYRK